MKKSNDKDSKLPTRSFSTKLIHGADHKNYPNGAHISPIYNTTTYDLRDLEFSGKVFAGKTKQDAYTRLSNPNHRELEEKLCLIEGGQAAQVFASGMGAFSTMIGSLTTHGDHIVAGCPLYGGSYNSLKNFWTTHENRQTSFVSVREQYDIAKHIRPDTKLLMFETIANPSIECWDIPFIVETAKKISPKIIIAVDNTVATSYNCQPLTMGADVVWHSLTKYFGEGHHLGGAIIGTKKSMRPILDHYFDLGAVLAPQSAWGMAEAGKTFGMRMERHNSNAMNLALWLEKRPEIARVSYLGLPSNAQHQLAKKMFRTPSGEPGYGGLLSFELKGSNLQMKQFLSAIGCHITFGVSLGTTDTLGSVPHYTTHSGMRDEEALLQGVTDRLIRLSVGCEDLPDIYAWFEEAFGSMDL